MISLETLWASASSVSEQCTTLAHWREMLGDRLPVLEHFLLCTDRLGSHIPKPGCKYTWFPIDEDGEDQIVVFDEDYGRIWRQPRRDGLAFKFNWTLFYRMMCDDMGIEFGYRSLEGFKFIRRIGTDRPELGVEIPVYHHRANPNLEIADLLAVTDGPLILLYSGKTELEEWTGTLFRNRGSLTISIPHSVAMNDRGSAVFVPSVKDRLNEFRSRHTQLSNIAAPEPIFEVPANANWSMVRIKFTDRHSIRVSIRGQSRTFHYSQLGMANSRNAEPTKQWLLLQKFGECGGFIHWQSTGASANVKKQTQELNKKLRAAFGIDGVPIEYEKDASGYRTVFSIEGDG